MTTVRKDTAVLTGVGGHWITKERRDTQFRLGGAITGHVSLFHYRNHDVDIFDDPHAY